MLPGSTHEPGFLKHALLVPATAPLGSLELVIPLPDLQRATLVPGEVGRAELGSPNHVRNPAEGAGHAIVLRVRQARRVDAARHRPQMLYRGETLATFSVMAFLAK